MSLSKQGYLAQRQKMDPAVFSVLNQRYLQRFYRTETYTTWHGFVVIAIDGSMMEVPNSKENRQFFYARPNVCARARINSVVDVWNHFCLDIQISPLSDNEIDMARQNVLAVRETLGPAVPILFIFDCYYPGIAFIDFLESLNVHYLIRMSPNKYIEEREKIREDDEEFDLLFTKARLANVKQKHPEQYAAMKVRGGTQSRMIVTRLTQTSQLTYFLTNLPMTIFKQEIIDLYRKRWKIELSYHTWKNKMKFESGTGNHPIYVYQDFWAQVIVYNMVQDQLRELNKVLAQKNVKKALKYPYQVNENVAIGLLKDQLVYLLFIEDPIQQQKELEKLKALMLKHLVPLRSSPPQPRKFKKMNKYQPNLKPSF